MSHKSIKNIDVIDFETLHQRHLCGIEEGEIDISLGKDKKMLQRKWKDGLVWSSEVGVYP